MEKSAGVVNDTEVRFESTESSEATEARIHLSCQLKFADQSADRRRRLLLRAVGWPFRSTITGLVERVPNPGNSYIRDNDRTCTI